MGNADETTNRRPLFGAVDGSRRVLGRTLAVRHNSHQQVEADDTVCERPRNVADTWLHVVIALISLYLGFMMQPDSATTVA